MSFTSSTITRLGPQNDNAPTLWVYKTADALTAVDGVGYFSALADRLKVGDWIFVSSTSTWGIVVVNQNTRDLTASPPVFGVVDCSNALSVGTIDSD